MKYRKVFGLVGLLMLAVTVAISWAGLQDRFSKVELEKDPYNRINIPEITAPSDSPLSNYGWVYLKDNDGVSTPYFEGDDGIVTNIATMNSVTIELSNADIKALRGTKKELVPAPGANKFIEFLGIVLVLDYGSNVLSESTDNLVVQYATSGDDVSGAIEMTGFIDQSADIAMARYRSNPLAANATADMVNNALELFNTGSGEFGGNAGADTTMTAFVTYRIHTVDL